VCVCVCVCLCILNPHSYCPPIQDQVFKMGDYILRLETSLFQAQQAASASQSSERPMVSDTSAAFTLATSLEEKRANRACCLLALSSWVSAVRALRAKRCGIVRLVTKSRRNKALLALLLWAHNRSLRTRVERKAASLVRRLQQRRMLVALRTWLRVKMRARDCMRRAARLIGAKRNMVLGSSLQCWESFSFARQV
jgi:hypothetical protein